MISIVTFHKCRNTVVKYLFGVMTMMPILVAQLPAQNSSLTEGLTPPGMAPGSPTGSYILSGMETVNCFNGKLNFRLPLLEIGARGEARHTINLMIERHWRVERFQNCLSCLPTEYPVDSWWSTLFGSYGPGFMEGRVAELWRDCTPTSSGQEIEYNFTRLTFTEPDGTEHELIDKLTGGALLRNNQACQGLPRVKNDSRRGKVFASRDGSAITFISDAEIFDSDYYTSEAINNTSPSGYLFMRDGRQFRIFRGIVLWIRDRNGNKLQFAYDDSRRATQILDSANRSVTIDYSEAYDDIHFKGALGAPRTIRIWYSPLEQALHTGYEKRYLDDLFPELITPENQYYNPRVVKLVELPNSQVYRFSYTDYGELAKVDLPTGGGLEYEFSSAAPGSTSGVYDIMVLRRLTKRTSYKSTNIVEGKTLYSATGFAAGDPTDTKATVEQQDPTGNPLAKQEHIFFGRPTDVFGRSHLSDAPYQEGRESEVKQYSANGATLLGKMQNTWIYTPYQFPRISETVTTLAETNQVSKQTFDHDQYNNQTELKEFHYGTGAPEVEWVRKTSRQFVTTLSGADYAGSTIGDSTDATSVIHIRNLPESEYVVDSGFNQRARTDYEYDNYADDDRHAPLKPRSNISGRMDPDTFTTDYTRRGNLTRLGRWLDTNNSTIYNYHQYDIAGNLVKTIDPRGAAATPVYGTTLDYDDWFGQGGADQPIDYAPNLQGKSSFAFLTKVTNPLLHVSETQYDYFLGKPVDVLDANLVYTSLFYVDALDRLTDVIRGSNTALANHTFYGYDPSQRTITTVSDKVALGDNQIVSQVVYDGLGRTSETRTYEVGSGYIASIQEYDALGRIRRVSNPHRPPETPAWTTTEYDSLNRIVSATTDDGAVVRSDYLGQETTATDQAGKKRKSETDALGRLKKVTEDPLGIPYETTYEYDVLDNLRTVIQGVQTRSFVYDSLSRLTETTNPESGRTEYPSYDGNGNLLQKKDARLVITNFTYDSLNRLKTRSYLDGVTPEVTLYYDAPAVAPAVTYSKGRLTSVSSSASSNGYDEYDALGRVKRSSQVTAGQQPYLMSYDYDLAGNMIWQRYPSQREISTSYDISGRISGVTGVKTGEANKTYVYSPISYWPHGAVKAMQLGNGLWEHTNINLSRLQPLQIGLGLTSTSSERLALDYGYGTTNNNGNVLTQSITVPGLFLSQTYGYDGKNRLQSATEGAWSQTYGYDQYGNRWVTPGSNMPNPGSTPQSQSYFNAITNRLDGTFGYVYDPAGNLIQDAQGRTFTYDAENRQKSFNNGVTTTYSYDGDGHRVTKIDSGGTTIFVYNVLGQLIAEYSDQLGSEASGTSYFTSDHLGSKRIMTDSAGVVKKRYDYLPFGEEIPTSWGGRDSIASYTASDNTKQKFTGKERDAESGLDYFGARYFSGAQGRFSSPDLPFADQYEDDPQSWNLYTYTRNNPLRFVDFNGRACRVNSQGGEYDDKNPGQSCAEVLQADKKIKPSVVVSAYMPGGLSPNAQFILANVYDKTERLNEVRTYVEAGVASALVGPVGIGVRAATLRLLPLLSLVIRPALPVGFATAREFGQYMEWGTGHASALQRMAVITRAAVDRITAADARAWADFYAKVAMRNPANRSAAGREQLMRRAYELLKDDGK